MKFLQWRPWLKIAKIDIGFVETEDVSINIYLSGCKLNCEECFSPHLKDFNSGKDASVDEVMDVVKERFELTKTVCFLGGNPPDNKNIGELTKQVKELGGIVWVYSGYDFEDIKDKEWVKYCDYIKAGPYIKELASMNYSYASTNQKLYKRESDKWIMEECYASVS